jgi:16S rRNA (cytidine1402-2'-O)-methyltransferase
MEREGSQPNDRGARSQTTTSDLPGTLYVVSTPIGHPDDITLRALAILRRVTIIASEDPPMTQTLLAHHGITATVTSYGPLNRHEKMLVLLHRLTLGQDIALVSDNGTPVIYDPGSLLVAAAHHARIPVMAIPGPSVLTAAAAISGFSGDAIVFEGHLPSTNRRLTQYLSQLRHERKTLIFYLNPIALSGLLRIMTKIFPTRQTVIALNLTTNKEALSRGKPSELLDQLGPVAKDSAVTVVIEGYQVGSYRKKMNRRSLRVTRLHGDG